MDINSLDLSALNALEEAMKTNLRFMYEYRDTLNEQIEQCEKDLEAVREAQESRWFEMLDKKTRGIIKITVDGKECNISPV